MSLLITTHMVSEVLLIDGWHLVDKGSFAIDPYEFIEQVNGGEGKIVHMAGGDGVCAVGFSFVSNGKRICGPLTAVQALKAISEILG